MSHRATASLLVFFLYQLLAALIVCLCFSRIAHAQVAFGTPSWSSYESHEVDTINLQNLNILLNIPVRSKAGAFQFQYQLETNSNCSVLSGAWFCGTSGTTVGIPGFAPVASGFLSGGNVWGGAGWSTGYNATCPDGQVTPVYAGWYIEEANRTIHPLPASDFIDGLGCLSTSISDHTIDGSGYTLVITGGTPCNYNGSTCTIYASNGNTFPLTSLTSATSVVDPNQNSIVVSGTTVTDTLGVTALTLNSATSPTSFSWTDVNGNNQSISEVTTSMKLGTNFGCTGITDQLGASGPVVTSIHFPSTNSMLLHYEPTYDKTGYFTGRLNSISLPTGGLITYAYSGGNQGINCTYQVPPTLTRTTSDGATTYNIAWQTSGGSCSTTTPCSTTTVVDPGGNKKVFTFSAGWGATAAGVTLALTEVQTYQNTGTQSNPTWSTTATTTDLYCYNGATTGCLTASVSLPISEQDVYHTIGGMSSSSRSQTQYDAYGNATLTAQYDFGASGYTTETQTAYGNWTGTTCSNINSTNTIHNKPCYVKTLLNGNVVTASYFTYSPEGNLLTAQAYQGTYYVGNTTANVYNTNGTISKFYDANNKETDYSYSSGSYVCVGGSCPSGMNLVFPTTITDKTTTLATNFTWNATGGVKLTEVGPNGATNQTTTYSYDGNCGSTADPFWRVGCVTDPLQNAYGASYSANQLQTAFAFNSGNSVDNGTKTVDGYGRTTSIQVQQGPSSSNYDTVSGSYSWPNTYFQTFVSTPCTAASGGSCTTGFTALYDFLNRPITFTDPGDDTTNGVTTYTYYTSGSYPDTLAARTPAPNFDGEHSKQVQNEYDGLGRLTISCAILSSGGSSCGEHSNSVSGIATTYSYTSPVSWQTKTSITRGSQTKSYQYDGLGRMVESTTPDAGQWQYLYDSSSSCSGSTNTQGRLVETIDPNGTVTCYSYDSLGRTVSVVASSSSSCTQRLFYYDGSTGFAGTIPSGVTKPANSNGRMVEAATTNCTGTIALITDEWFSYDQDGNVTDFWEMTPNSGTYYHTQATFFGNRTVNTLEIANPKLYTQTYGLDGEGRPTSLSASTGGGTTIVSATTFNAAGQPTNIAIGSGTDYDAYTYSTMGRMKTWTFQVGTTPAQETSILTWNPIGTLQSLAITDGFNSGGTQTCNFGTSSPANMGYDDLNRLIYDDCGSGNWGQTFSYDQYDNITKGVISGRTGVTFAPGYNSTNNRYASGTTYDSDGNILSDASSMNTYSWNEFKKLKSVNAIGTNCATSGQCIVYDALGRIVEIDSGSTPTEILYSQLGKTMYLNGSTQEYAYWPTPGGGTLLQNPGSYYYEHKDWLGNARISSSVANEGIIDDRAFAPYGEIYATYGSTAQKENIFTGDTQDVVAGMYDTPNRELVANQGRWISPDPAQASWNFYAYVTNPNSMKDPTGLDYCFYGGTDQTPQDDDDASDFNLEEPQGAQGQEDCAEENGQWESDSTSITVDGDNPDVVATYQDGEPIYPETVPGNPCYSVRGSLPSYFVNLQLQAAKVAVSALGTTWLGDTTGLSITASTDTALGNLMLPALDTLNIQYMGSGTVTLSVSGPIPTGLEYTDGTFFMAPSVSPPLGGVQAYNVSYDASVSYLQYSHGLFMNVSGNLSLGSWGFPVPFGSQVIEDALNGNAGARNLFSAIASYLGGCDGG